MKVVFGLIALLIAIVESHFNSNIPTANNNSNQTERANFKDEKVNTNASESKLWFNETIKDEIFGNTSTLSEIDLPLQFDAREKWEYCPSLNHIRHEGSCMRSWAVSAVSAMSDRLCIQSDGRENVYFSELDVTTCCMNCGSPCGGGLLKKAWQYGVRKGIVSGGNEGCKPYTIPPCEYGNNNGSILRCVRESENFRCTFKCQPSFTKSYFTDRRRLRMYYNMTDVRSIMRDIYRNGPVTTNMELYVDFLEYRSGIYSYSAGKQIGYQSVKLLGWGEENGVKYWLGANSWGTNWGDEGFFKIKRGVNHLGIENIAYAGIFRT